MAGRPGPSYTVRGYSLPRAGTFGGRPRSLLARAFARNSVLRQMDWLLVVVVCGLSAIGVVLVWSATQPSLLAAGDDPHTYMKKQLLWAVIGLVLMFAVSFVDSRRLRSWTPAAYGTTLLALLAVLVPHIGSDINGARAWINLPGGFQIEPSEFAKIALVLVIATAFSRARGATPGLRQLLWALAGAAPLMALVAIEPALGVTLVLVAVTTAMIVLSGIKLRIIVGLAAVVAAVVALAGGTHLLKSYQLTRFTSFLHPSADLSAWATTRPRPRSRSARAGCSVPGCSTARLWRATTCPPSRRTSSSPWPGRNSASPARSRSSSCCSSSSSARSASRRGPRTCSAC